MCVCSKILCPMEQISGTEEGGRSSGSSGRQTPPRIAQPQPSPSQSPLSREGSTTGGKILSRNVNGTMVLTSTPSNEAELQLYRVMQRASLLAYYDTLLEMGGDDVQQLCDAGEEEFLEIMALVGMASKPLHVRRLQKALQEWVTNPSLFQAPLLPNLCSNDTSPFLSCSPRLIGLSAPSLSQSRSTVASPDTNRPIYSTSPGIPESSQGSSTSVPAASPVSCSFPTSATAKSPYPSNYSPLHPPQGPLLLTPALTDVQISRLAGAAERLSRHLPQLEPRPQNAKKKMCRDLEQVMLMSEGDPRRMDEIRKYAAIYGRFDCKRKPEKPLTLHEVSVNEAAAQICRFVPALLTRRDELFPLARQVVRDSGYPHTHSRVNSQTVRTDSDSSDLPSAKRPRLHQSNLQGEAEACRQDMCDEATLMTRAALLPLFQRVQAYEQSENSKMSYYATIRNDSDDADSRYSFSNSSSPPAQVSNGSEQDSVTTFGSYKEEIRLNDCTADTTRDLTSPFSDNKVQVIAASGGHIIAVANPALALSPNILPDSMPQIEQNVKRECVSPVDNR